MLEILLKVNIPQVHIHTNKNEKKKKFQAYKNMPSSIPNVKNGLVLMIQKVFRKSNPLSIYVG